jgi:hypothetical protein
LPIQREIAQNSRSKLSEGDETSDRLVVFSFGDVLCFEIGAIGIWGAGAGQRGFQYIAAGGYDPPVQTTNCHLIAGLCNRVFRLSVKFGIALQNRIDIGTGLNVRSMIHKFFDGDMRRQFGECADMVVVVVSDDQVIDLLKASILDGGHNAPCVTNGAISTVPRIDKHRFSGGCDKKDGVAALHVDHINLQRLRSFGLCDSKRCEKDQTP